MPFNLKVGGAWKQGTGAKVKVGGAWKTVESIQVKVGGAWKVAFTNSITPIITATVDPNPSSFTQDVTISGFVLPVPTGGTVLVRDNGSNPVGTEANVDTNDGSYSITIPDQSVGTYNFSVTYSGFEVYQEVFTNVTVNVGTIPTTTSIARSADTYVFNQTRVTISGAVTPVPSGGTVRLSSPTQGIIATVGVDTSTGAYSVLTPVRDTGSYTNISALYSGSGNFASSTSGVTSYSVTQATSTISANTSSSSVQAGNTVTLSANLTTPPPPAAPGQVGTFVQQPLSGRTVTFQGLNSSSAWVNLGTGVTDSGGNATFTWTAVSGYTQIRAVYAGELNYSGQTSGGVAINVFTFIATFTSISRSAASYSYNGTRVTISGTVNPPPPGGVVDIKSGTTTIATATVNTSTGAYSVLMPVQNASTTAYTVFAQYSGFGGLYLPSESGTTSYTVNKAATAITNTGAFDVNSGTSVTLSTTLTTGGSGFNNQTVTFQVRRSSDNAWVNAGTGTTNASGYASFSWTTSSSYNQSRATFSGGTNYNDATSTGVAFTTRGRVTTSISTSTAGSNWYWRGSSGSAQQVGTNITSPDAVSGANQYAVYRIDIAVSGINGRQGQAAACMWTSGNNGTLLIKADTRNLTNRADGSTNTESWTITPTTYTPGTVYKFGFWRRGNSTTYNTQWRQNNGTGRNTYWDNSAAAAGTFDHDTTYSGHSLDMTVYYQYYVKNN